MFSGNANQTYWNGGGDDGYAKVGYCGWGWDECRGIDRTRSFFNFDTSFLAGRHILSAEFNVFEAHAPSCSARKVELWETNYAGPGTTWNNQPGGWAYIDVRNVAKGYGSSCPAGWVGFRDVGPWTNAGGTTTYMLKAPDVSETDKYAWKKFYWDVTLIVSYNTPPGAPSDLAVRASAQSPAHACATEPDEPSLTTAQALLYTRVADPDGDAVYADFEWDLRHSGGPAVGGATAGPVASGQVLSVQIPAGTFRDSDRVAWRVRSSDGRHHGPWSGWCDVTVDLERPRLPGVVSDLYPRDGTGGSRGQSALFTFTANDPDVVGFHYGLGFDPDAANARYVAAGAPGGQAQALVTPSTLGRTNLWVAAVDEAGNRTLLDASIEAHRYTFFVGRDPVPHGHWRLDGSNTDTVADDSSLADGAGGGTRHGTVAGMYPATGAHWVAGRDGDALRIDGTGRGHVTAESAIRTDWAFTASAWVWVDPAASTTWRTALSQAGERNSGFFLQYGGPMQTFAFGMHLGDGNGGAVVAAEPGGRTGVWTHLAGTYDPYSRKLLLYVNGALAAEAESTTRWQAGGGLQIGRARHNGGWVEPWFGHVDDVRVFQRALQPDEIQQLAGTPARAELHYPFDDDPDQLAGDHSGNHRVGTFGPSAVREANPDGAGDAVRLDGSTAGWVESPHSPIRTDQSFTAAAWVLPADLGASARTVLSQHSGGGAGFTLSYRPGTGDGDGGGWSAALPHAWTGTQPTPVAVAPGTAAEGTPSHLMMVYDAGAATLSLYVDGALADRAAPVAPRPQAVLNALQIGRSRTSAGTFQSHFDGLVDEVRVWTGVLDAAQIERLAGEPPEPPATPYTGMLTRFVSHAGDNLSTDSGFAPHGYRVGWPLGVPVPEGTPGTRRLYACLDGTDAFTSLDRGCEGRRRVDDLGLLYASPPAGAATAPVYRCQIAASGERFDSNDAGCEGHRVQSLLGHALAYRPLVRHLRHYPPYDHRSEIAGVPAGYRAEARLGLLAVTAEPGVRGLWSCLRGTDEFSSTDPACEGAQVRHWLGQVWREPPSHAAESRLLYRCRTSDTGEYFDSTDPDCEGSVVDRELGYVVTCL